MPIGNSTRVGTGRFFDPGLMQSLLGQGIFPQTCTLESYRLDRTLFGDAKYDWQSAGDYVKIPCRKFDRLPHDDRTLEIIEEVKYWTIALAGYFPNIDPSWRIRIDDTNELFSIEGVDSDSMHLMTVLTARLFTPSGEVAD